MQTREQLPLEGRWNGGRLPPACLLEGACHLRVCKGRRGDPAEQPVFEGRRDLRWALLGAGLRPPRNALTGGLQTVVETFGRRCGGVRRPPPSEGAGTRSRQLLGRLVQRGTDERRLTALHLSEQPVLQGRRRRCRRGSLRRRQRRPKVIFCPPPNIPAASLLHDGHSSQRPRILANRLRAWWEAS